MKLTRNQAAQRFQQCTKEQLVNALANIYSFANCNENGDYDPTESTAANSGADFIDAVDNCEILPLLAAATDATQLYYIAFTDDDGNDQSLFVRDLSPNAAIEHWQQWRESLGNAVPTSVFEINTTTTETGVLHWHTDDIRLIDMDANADDAASDNDATDTLL